MVNVMHSQNSFIFSTAQATNFLYFISIEDASVGISTKFPIGMFWSYKFLISPNGLTRFATEKFATLRAIQLLERLVGFSAANETCDHFSFPGSCIFTSQ
jgi:hypothetical protein